MKKQISVLLVVIMLLTYTTAFAEDWTCPTCNSAVSGNFCNNCGAAKPSDEWVCPNCKKTVNGNFCNTCGTARPDNTSAITDALSFEDVLNYLLSPISNVKVKNIINIGNSTFTVSMKDGTSYMGLISDSDGIYAIEIVNASSSNYTSFDTPYNYQDGQFVDVLNFLIRNSGRSVVSVIPMFDSVYTAHDSAGTTYMVSTSCSPAAIIFGLLQY